MVPVIHTVCGKQVGWYDGSTFERKSQKYMRLDGSKPHPKERVMEYCPHCKRIISNPQTNMKLDFSGQQAVQ